MVEQGKTVKSEHRFVLQFLVAPPSVTTHPLPCPCFPLVFPRRSVSNLTLKIAQEFVAMSFLLSICNPCDLTPTPSHALAPTQHTLTHGMCAFVYAMLFGFNTSAFLSTKSKIAMAACFRLASRVLRWKFIPFTLMHGWHTLAPTLALTLTPLLLLPTLAWRSVQIICGFVKFAQFLFLYKIAHFATAEHDFGVLNARLGCRFAIVS